MWIIVGGFVNFLVFTVIYIAIGGDARNGFVGEDVRTGQIYYLIHTRLDAPPRNVSWGWFLYSHIHGLSIGITAAAVLLAMLTLLKDHFVGVLKESGRVVIHAAVTFILLIVIVTTILVHLDFRYSRTHPRPVTNTDGVIQELRGGQLPAAHPPPGSQADER